MEKVIIIYRKSGRVKEFQDIASWYMGGNCLILIFRSGEKRAIPMRRIDQIDSYPIPEESTEEEDQ